MPRPMRAALGLLIAVLVVVHATHSVAESRESSRVANVERSIAEHCSTDMLGNHGHDAILDACEPGDTGPKLTN